MFEVGGTEDCHADQVRHFGRVWGTEAITG